MVIGFEKEIQTECLVAFAHSRIIGLMARDCEKDNLSAYAGTIRTASRFTSGHSAGVDSDS